MTERLRTVSEHMADSSQHFVWVADEATCAPGQLDLTSWRAHCSCGWKGSLASEALASFEAALHKEAAP